MCHVNASPRPCSWALDFTRSLLVLRNEAAAAFDAGAQLLTPSAGGAGRSRLFRANTPRLPAMCPRVLLAGMAGRTLHLPLAAEGRVPCVRLLGWTAVSHLRDRSEADAAWREAAETASARPHSHRSERWGPCAQ
jgi:hypothetical protein